MKFIKLKTGEADLPIYVGVSNIVTLHPVYSSYDYTANGHQIAHSCMMFLQDGRHIFVFHSPEEIFDLIKKAESIGE